MSVVAQDEFQTSVAEEEEQELKNIEMEQEEEFKSIEMEQEVDAEPNEVPSEQIASKEREGADVDDVEPQRGIKVSGSEIASKGSPECTDDTAAQDVEEEIKMEVASEVKADEAEAAAEQSIEDTAAEDALNINEENDIEADVEADAVVGKSQLTEVLHQAQLPEGLQEGAPILETVGMSTMPEMANKVTMSANNHEGGQSKETPDAEVLDDGLAGSWAKLATLLILEPPPQELPRSLEPLAESSVEDGIAKDTVASKDTVPSDQGLDAKLIKAQADIVEASGRVSDSETSEGTAEAATSTDNDTHLSDPDSAAVASETGGQEKTARKDDSAEERVIQVQATLPQDLSFKAPAGCVPGQDLLVQGPHGPMQVRAPPGVKPGMQVTVRLAAPILHEVFVPAGAVPGQKVTFVGENDEQLEAIVPSGKKPGQVFHVSPPVVMVPIPLGAVPGDLLAFTVPAAPNSFKPQVARVPDNMGPGQYFAVKY